jgi:hypothetical protein
MVYSVIRPILYLWMAFSVMLSRIESSLKRVHHLRETNDLVKYPYLDI